MRYGIGGFFFGRRWWPRLRVFGMGFHRWLSPCGAFGLSLSPPAHIPPGARPHKRLDAFHREPLLPTNPNRDQPSFGDEGAHRAFAHVQVPRYVLQREQPSHDGRPRWRECTQPFQRGHLSPQRLHAGTERLHRRRIERHGHARRGVRRRLLRHPGAHPQTTKVPSTKKAAPLRRPTRNRLPRACKGIEQVSDDAAMLAPNPSACQGHGHRTCPMCIVLYQRISQLCYNPIKKKMERSRLGRSIYDSPLGIQLFTWPILAFPCN